MITMPVARRLLCQVANSYTRWLRFSGQRAGTSFALTRSHRINCLLKKLIPLRKRTLQFYCGPLLLGGTAYFMSSGLSQGGRDFDSLILAIHGDDSAALRQLIKKGIDPNVRHEFGWTPLLVAAYHGKAECVRVLLDCGADVDLPDEFIGMQATAVQSHVYYLKVVEARDESFDRRLRGNENFAGTTPLHYAVLGNQEEVMEILMEFGADPNIRNQVGHLPSDYAPDQRIRDRLDHYAKEFESERKKREAEQRRRFPLEERIKEKIIGQDGAISTVAAAIRRKENGWYDEEHPLVFLFLGSSGIGKTELAKQVAAYLDKDEKKGFIRMDMSEYQQKHEVAKFIGSPPGYVGHDEGGQLTKKLGDCPSAVVLFDEVEKAHPDILTIMLQLFDEGRLTDGQGKTVECRDAIFIMTSNLASEEIADHAVQLREEAARVNRGKLTGNIDDVNITEKVTISRRFKEKTVQPILKRHFRRDEFLGRINEMVYFLPFSQGELVGLVKRELEFWKSKAFKNHEIDLQWTDTVLQVLAQGYNIRYGARSIKHEVDRRVVNKLAGAQERGLISQGSVVNVVAERSGEESDPAGLGGVIELEVKQESPDGKKKLSLPLTKSLLHSLGTVL